MVTFQYRWLLNRGDHKGRFDCICVVYQYACVCVCLCTHYKFRTYNNIYVCHTLQYIFWYNMSTINKALIWQNVKKFNYGDIYVPPKFCYFHHWCHMILFKYNYVESSVFGKKKFNFLLSYVNYLMKYVINIWELHWKFERTI